MHWSFTFNTSCLQFWICNLCFSGSLSSWEEIIPLHTGRSQFDTFFFYVFFATIFCYTGIFWNLKLVNFCWNPCSAFLLLYYSALSTYIRQNNLVVQTNITYYNILFYCLIWPCFFFIFHFLLYKYNSAVICLKCCRYSIKHYPINQLI